MYSRMIRHSRSSEIEALLQARGRSNIYPFGSCFSNALAYQRVHGGKLVCGAVGYKMYEMGYSHRPYVDLHYGE